jgi:hypothetical protein
LFGKDHSTMINAVNNVRILYNQLPYFTKVVNKCIVEMEFHNVVWGKISFAKESSWSKVGVTDPIECFLNGYERPDRINL